MNQIAHKFMAKLKVYKDMANEEDYNERGIKTRSIANNGNGHDNSDSNDSDIRMMNVFSFSSFRMDSRSLEIHERNKSFYVRILLVLHSFFRGFGRCRLWFDSIR